MGRRMRGRASKVTGIVLVLCMVGLSSVGKCKKSVGGGVVNREKFVEKGRRYYHPKRTENHVGTNIADIENYEIIHKNGPKPRVPPGPRPKFIPGTNSSGIFFAIASYRDKECSGTILSIFEKAAHPERVFVGVVQQINADVIEEDCFYICTEEGNGLVEPELRERFFKHVCPRIDNRQIIDTRIAYTHAKGVMYARHNAQWLLQDQEFAVMIDSHSEFAPGYDNLMIANWNEIHNEMAVISTYPKHFNDRNDQSTWDQTNTIPQLCQTKFVGNGIPRHQSAREVGTTTSHISAFWGACFSFSKSHAWRRVTFDPYSYFAFDPEEFSYGSRLWTHGYDLYTPSFNYIYHQYYVADQKQPKKRELYFHEKSIMSFKEKAVRHVDARIRYVLDGKPEQHEERDLRDVSHYGLGDVRSWESFLEFAEINMKERTTGDICDKTWKDQLPLVPLNYIPDLSGEVFDRYKDHWFDTIKGEGKGDK